MKSKIEKNSFRNIRDMNSNLGSFAASLKDKDVWVMNVVPVNESSKLKIIYDRGLFGTVHDWLFAFGKYLLRKKNFKEAIHLLEELECEGEMTKEMLSFMHAQVGFLLLFDLHFVDAVNHFLQSETMQPSEIFPFIMQDPNHWSQLGVIRSVD
ncbi:vacuolar sorting protein 3-like [Magnolia sinica]|uniref:vacuolar sorting protein 3-like n=1 Tax=Magnolia sinica TaxID=86752 RepID=UPI00265B318A|nr:vacuolar sorting protein 3-like [Magnolia sinica]